MLVYLVRHAVAVPREAVKGFDDAARELTPRGTRRMRRHVDALVHLNVQIDRIWTSPLVRAVQTADILTQMQGFSGTSDILDALAPGGDVSTILQKLVELEDGMHVALVGHEPDLGLLGTRLLRGPGHSILEFKKGAVACIDVERSGKSLRGRLCWLLSPRQLRCIARAGAESESR